MIEKQDHTLSGTVSMILGILGLINVFIIGYIVGLPLGIIAFILGHISKKQNDRFGYYGYILGMFTIIVVVSWLIIAIIMTNF